MTFSWTVKFTSTRREENKGYHPVLKLSSLFGSSLSRPSYGPQCRPSLKMLLSATSKNIVTFLKVE